MQSSPRGKQYGRRGKREPVVESQVEPVTIVLDDAEVKRRLYNRGW